MKRTSLPSILVTSLRIVASVALVAALASACGRSRKTFEGNNDPGMGGNGGIGGQTSESDETCTKPCEGNGKNGVARCESEGNAEPRTPRLLKPTLGAFTGSLRGSEKTQSLRPNFTWREVSGACDDIEYQIQIDDSCTVAEFKDCPFDSPEVDVRTQDTSYQPAEDLQVSQAVPVGSRYSWRVRACSQDNCSAWSEIRYVDVGRDRQDVTGDGYADVVTMGDFVSGEGMRYVIFAGGAEFGTGVTVPIDVLANRQFEQTGNTGGHEFNPPVVRFVGDLNGDGFGDFVANGSTRLVVDPSEDGPPPENCHERHIFLGASTVKEIAVVSWFRHEWTPGALEHNFAAGDFNGDGYADILTPTTGAATNHNSTQFPDLVPHVGIVYGGEYLTSKAASQVKVAAVIQAPPGSPTGYFGESADSGDFNGDGLVDLVILSPQERIAHIVQGGNTVDLGIDLSFSYALGATSTCPDSRLAVADINQDGFDDFAVTCDGADRLVEVYYGKSTLPTKMGWSFNFKTTGEPFIDNPADLVFADLNHDGYHELLTGNGRVFEGGMTLAMTPTRLFELTGPSMGAADHNGDGNVDVLWQKNPLTWFVGDGSLSPKSTAELSSSANEAIVSKTIGR